MDEIDMLIEKRWSAFSDMIVLYDSSRFRRNKKAVTIQINAAVNEIRSIDRELSSSLGLEAYQRRVKGSIYQ